MITIRQAAVRGPSHLHGSLAESQPWWEIERNHVQSGKERWVRMKRRVRLREESSR